MGGPSAGVSNAIGRAPQRPDATHLREADPLTTGQLQKQPLRRWLLAVLQALISLGGDSAVMDEHVRSIVPSDKSVPLGVIEPLYRSFHTFHVPPLACTLWLDQGRDVILCDIVRPAHSAVKGVIARKPTIHALSRHFCAMRARGWQKWFCCRESCLLAPGEARSTARPAACE